LVDPVADLLVIEATPDEVAPEFLQDGWRPQWALDPGLGDGQHRVAQVGLQQNTGVQKDR
jgi:hypothetical protein